MLSAFPPQAYHEALRNTAVPSEEWLWAKGLVVLRELLLNVGSPLAPWGYSPYIWDSKKVRLETPICEL